MQRIVGYRATPQLDVLSAPSRCEQTGPRILGIEATIALKAHVDGFDAAVAGVDPLLTAADDIGVADAGGPHPPHANCVEGDSREAGAVYDQLSEYIQGKAENGPLDHTIGRS